MLIQAALNGGRSRQEHPALPQTPEELAADDGSRASGNGELVAEVARRRDRLAPQ